jgi:hypothetical protein
MQVINFWRRPTRLAGVTAVCLLLAGCDTQSGRAYHDACAALPKVVGDITRQDPEALATDWQAVTEAVKPLGSKSAFYQDVQAADTNGSVSLLLVLYAEQHHCPGEGGDRN